MEITYEVILNVKSKLTGAMITRSHDSNNVFNIATECNYIMNAFSTRFTEYIKVLENGNAGGFISIRIPELAVGAISLPLNNIDEFAGITLLALYAVMRETTDLNIGLDSTYESLYEYIKPSYNLASLSQDEYVRIIDEYRKDSSIPSNSLDDVFTSAITKMVGTEVNHTYKDLLESLTKASSIINGFTVNETLSKEATKLFESVESFIKDSKYVSRPQTFESERAPMLLVQVGHNKVTFDVSIYFNIREAINSLKEKIFTSIGEGFTKNTSFMMDFRGSTYTSEYNPKDIDYIAFKVEEGLHTLLKKYF